MAHHDHVMTAKAEQPEPPAVVWKTKIIKTLCADCPGFLQQDEVPGSQKNIAYFQKLLQGYDSLVKDTTSAAWWLVKQSPQVSKSTYHSLYFFLHTLYLPLYPLSSSSKSQQT